LPAISLKIQNINPDVLIAGGGNAALCAAITAAEAGASVLLLESAPKPYRGGNSRHVRNFRCMHTESMGVLTGQYGEDEYFDDLLKVTEGKTDEELARTCIRASEDAYGWMHSHGVRFQPSISGTLSLSRTNAFFLGGGKALVNACYRCAEALGVEIVYEAPVTHLEYDGGTPYNRGVVLKDLLEQGIESVGDPAQCHAVAIDGRAPKFDGGIVTRLDCVPFAVVVNKNGARFYDEGEDVWPKRYAIWGRLVAAQPQQVGYAIIDSKALDLFMPSVFPPVQADTVQCLAEKMKLPVQNVEQTIQAFNAACRPGEFKPDQLDGLATAGLTPPKSNWARAIDTPPFYGYELRPGVTFTYLGLKVDENAQVQSAHGTVENLWAAGEIMAGSLLGKGYLAGLGMTIGTVFGRLAGQGAARYVK